MIFPLSFPFLSHHLCSIYFFLSFPCPFFLESCSLQSFPSLSPFPFPSLSLSFPFPFPFLSLPFPFAVDIPLRLIFVPNGICLFLFMHADNCNPFHSMFAAGPALPSLLLWLLFTIAVTGVRSGTLR